MRSNSDAMQQPGPLDLDILPEKYRPRRVTMSKIIAITVAALLLLGLLPAYRALATARARTAVLQARLSQANAALTETRSEQTRIEQELEGIGQQIEQARTQITRLQAEFNGLGQQRTPRSDCIAAAIGALIPQVHIVTLVQEGNTLNLSGQAGSLELVLDYSRALQASGQFANVRIVSMVNADPLESASEIEFSIEVEIER